MINVFMNTWGNYNENGADFGKWLTLPMDKEELENKLAEIANAMQDNNPEWFINDYECEDFYLKIGENEDIFELNELAWELDDLDDYDKEIVNAIMEADGCGVLEAIEKKDICEYYSGMTLEEVAEEIVEDCYNLPEFALRYFDYEAFARDLGFDGYTEVSCGVICVR